MLGGRWFAISLILTAYCIPATAQDNSPYSRYGLGDLVPNTNIITRGMGGVTAGYTDRFAINYNNPASYGSFQAERQQTSNKLNAGRAILDVGINLESRTLREPNNVNKFTASNAIFSHVQVGVPLRQNWGLSFGLRPINRISYKLARFDRLTDPNTGQPIDSALTTNEGDGGTYLVSGGTGFLINLDKAKMNTLSLGINGGYLFGKKDISNRVALINDSLSYNAGNFQTRSTYGNFHINAGLQYTKYFKRIPGQHELLLTLGAFGNLKHDLNGRQDIVRETYVYDPTTGYNRLDSVTETRDVKGVVTYPSQFTAGFMLEQRSIKKVSWSVGVDVVRQNWDEFIFFGEKDPTLRSRTEIRVGGQIRPIPRGNYFSFVAYRVGFFMGNDYLQVQQEKIPVFGTSLGLELPIRNFSRQQIYEVSKINLAFEFIRRGNNNNLLKENMFRLSAGFSLSDFWFIKRKFD